MGSYTFADSCQALYDFWLKLFCNNYLEMAKPLLYGPECDEKAATQAVLQICMELGFRALHPFMPFVTEELWQRMQWRRIEADELESIMLCRFPARNDAWLNPAVAAEFEDCQK